MTGMSRSRGWIALIFAAALLLAWLWLIDRGSPPVATTTNATTIAVANTRNASLPTAAATIDVATAADTINDNLPPEALATLRLIASHGPFPYDRDGVVFNNFEHRLPEQARGYYHEYTVPTPGADNRGARRIITGGDPPQIFYYTDDHYQTFRQIGAKP
jgi:guanyl-specific ribonuclease Sa